MNFIHFGSFVGVVFFCTRVNKGKKNNVAVATPDGKFNFEMRLFACNTPLAQFEVIVYHL